MHYFVTNTGVSLGQASSKLPGFENKLNISPAWFDPQGEGLPFETEGDAHRLA